MKQQIPSLRIISVDHDRTILAEQRLRKAMNAAGLKYVPIRNVFCHLESGRCGIKSGTVAVEVDGCIVWGGKELTERLADLLCEGLTNYIQKQNNACASPAE